jgi:putative ABC transport system permease protein
MASTRERPPLVAQWLLRRAVRDVHEREMILGDLYEEWPRRSRTWYWRQAAGIALHVLARRDDSVTRTNTIQGDSVMRIWLLDVRFAWRALVKRPALSLVVAFTLALGLGANATVFELIDRLVLRPFPLPDVDRIVMLSETGPGIRYKREETAPANFVDWRARFDTLDNVAGMQWWDANLVYERQPERVQGYDVSAGFFETLGVRPTLGRTFLRDDEIRGRHRVVIVGDDLWKRRLGANPAIVGRALTVDGEQYEIVGVAPPHFQFPEGTELWAPLSFDAATAAKRDARYLSVIGRVKPGREIADVRAQAAVIGDRLARDYPVANRDIGIVVSTLRQGMQDEGLGPILSLWQASAAIVLLIACVNITNVLLAFATGRRREIAVRLALGASRGRLIRELLTESALVAALAVPLALAFGWLSLHAIRASMPPRIGRFVPGWESLGLDPRMVGFTVVVAIATSCLFGVLPALQAARSNVTEALKEGGRSVAFGRHRLRQGLVIAEMSIALPLLVAAGLGVIGAYRFILGPQGYNPEGVLTMKIVLPMRTYADAKAQLAFLRRSMDELAAVPGVERAAAVNIMPAIGANASRAMEIEGHAPPAKPSDLPQPDYRTATPEYLPLMEIPVRRGRGFTSADREGTAPVAIVSEAAARAYFQGADPIGRRIRLKGSEWITIVGVSGDIIHHWFDRRNAPTIYRPLAQDPQSFMCVVLKTSGDAGALSGPVREALLKVDPGQPVFEMMTMQRAVSENAIGLQYVAAIMAVFGIIALVLAVVGLYAVMAYLVTQRTHEIGVRMALGAAPRDVLRVTVGQALRLAGIGCVLGLVLSALLGKVMQAGLLGIASDDAKVSAIFAAVLILCATLAAYVPARRAAGIDPMAALRAE